MNRFFGRSTKKLTSSSPNDQQPPTTGRRTAAVRVAQGSGRSAGRSGWVRFRFLLRSGPVFANIVYFFGVIFANYGGSDRGKIFLSITDVSGRVHFSVVRVGKTTPVRGSSTARWNSLDVRDSHEIIIAVFETAPHSTYALFCHFRKPSVSNFEKKR